MHESPAGSPGDFDLIVVNRTETHGGMTLTLHLLSRETNRAILDFEVVYLDEYLQRILRGQTARRERIMVSPDLAIVARDDAGNEYQNRFLRASTGSCGIGELIHWRVMTSLSPAIDVTARQIRIEVPEVLLVEEPTKIPPYREVRETYSGPWIFIFDLLHRA